MESIVGRYAPSPTGDLHLGNLRTALLAWLHARLLGGSFKLRMEDLDTPRVVQGSSDGILADLEWLGLDWDGQVIYQSKRQDLYFQALDTLRRQNLLYPCFCSRKDLREIASAPHGTSTPYPGICAPLSEADIQQKTAIKKPAIRVRVDNSDIGFNDALLGWHAQSLSKEVGDFVIKRADGLFAYQLAVVVDDIEQGVSHIVRGADLIDSSPRQLYLKRCLAPEQADFEYWHLPLVTDASGLRLAKRDGSSSAKTWKSNGLSAENMIAKFAYELNLIDNQEELTAETLKSELSIESLQSALKSLPQQTFITTE